MKNLLLTIIGFSLSVMADAQFHTITNTPTLYKVKTAAFEMPADSTLLRTQKDSTPTADLSTDDVLDSISTEGNTVGMDVVAMKQELLRQYLSVSYPLRHIKVTSAFGMRKHPILHKRMMHQGIDLRAKYEEVYSVMDGEVIEVSSDKRSGKYITVRYPGAYTCSYCHLSHPMVRKGDHVNAGEVIAISGNSGMSSSAHLHFGVRNADGERLDPIILLEFIRKTRENVTKKLQALNNIESEVS